jgi:hypothetical protein
MLSLVLEAALGRRKFRTLRRLVAGITAAVLIVVPGAAAAMFRTAVHEEQARITPLVDEMMRQVVQHLDHGHRLYPPRAIRQHPHR